MSLTQLVNICIIMQGIEIQTPVIPLIHFKSEILNHQTYPQGLN
jgi:hypothetical protein